MIVRLSTELILLQAVSGQSLLEREKGTAPNILPLEAEDKVVDKLVD